MLALKPTPLQEAFITSPAEETLYGGARGGGKTFATILDWLVHSESYGKFARGVVFRRTLVELDDFIEAAKDVLVSSGHVWTEGKKFFRSPGGAVLRCRYLENDADAEKYQGHAYSRIYIEEIGNFPSQSPIRKLLGALRPPVAGGPPIRCQLKATANPGGPGHTWVKARYIDPAPAKTPFQTGDNRYKIFIPARLVDNPHLLNNDPDYVGRLKDAGSAELVKAWLDGNWNVVVGQYFQEFDEAIHVIPSVELPPEWKVRYRAMDWGSARPYAVGWFAVATGEQLPGVDRFIPRGALVMYRESYGWNGTPNVGRRQTSAEVAREVMKAELDDHDIIENNSSLNKIDPSTFATNGGPSIAEEMARVGVWWKRADNRRVASKGAMGGWDQVRKRLRGIDGIPMLFIMDSCRHILRTLPMIPCDPVNLDDIDTDSEDHAADMLRYACMARPYTPPETHREKMDMQYGRPLSSFTMDEMWSCNMSGGHESILRN